jgi:hypothetical protein
LPVFVPEHKQASSHSDSDIEPDDNTTCTSTSTANEVPGISGVNRCKRSDLKVGDFVVVNFSVDTQDKLFLGRIESLNKKSYEGLFMRNSSSKDGSVFTFPANEDRCIFDYNSVKGVLNPPVPLRRGGLKFEGVNAKLW